MRIIRSFNVNRFSRRILWLRLANTNNDPKVIAHYYLECVQTLGGESIYSAAELVFSYVLMGTIMLY